MMTSSNGNIFRVTGPLCGEFTGPGEFPTQRPVMRSFDVFFELRLNKHLSKQPWGWWFETPLWGHAASIFNSLWPSNAICWYRFRSTMAHVMACRLKAPSHYWTNVDLSSMVFSDIHLRPVLQEVLNTSISKITLLQLLPHLSEANELMSLLFSDTGLDIFHHDTKL